MRSISSSMMLLTSAPGTICLNNDESRCMVFKSERTASSAPGYCTLTATTRPSLHTARCTCPMLAEATGLSSKDWKRSRHFVPNWASRTRWTLSAGSGGASLCSLVRASRKGSAKAGGMAASNTDSAWPSFMAAPLSSPSTWKSCSAAFSIISALTSSLDLPVSRFPTPSAARPAIPAGSDASFAARAARPRRISAMGYIMPGPG
ncbi:Uncharacterised protein [Mycobacteroides abscessus subsp. abscessus]|nr:Uncharacterised protein [Mycobacteroides abscessus subsp. abscessus]